jgi:hypothetical protein
LRHLDCGFEHCGTRPFLLVAGDQLEGTTLIVAQRFCLCDIFVIALFIYCCRRLLASIASIAFL